MVCLGLVLSVEVEPALAALAAVRDAAEADDADGPELLRARLAAVRRLADDAIRGARAETGGARRAADSGA